MRYSTSYHRRSVAAHTVTRRCRRCEQHYQTAPEDPDGLCLRCGHNKDFERRVAEWFLQNPFAHFEVYTIFDARRVRVILNDGRDWIEYEEEHPVYLEAVRRQKTLAGKIAV
jgi:hypothetical protein